jgi:hypothetical protein
MQKLTIKQNKKSFQILKNRIKHNRNQRLVIKKEIRKNELKNDRIQNLFTIIFKLVNLY